MISVMENLAYSSFQRVQFKPDGFAPSKKLRVVISGIFYPVAMMHYFIRAFMRRDDVELFTIGPFTGTWIPWNGGMNLPDKYVMVPDIALPRHTITFNPPPSLVEHNLPWEPDLWLQIDAGWHFSMRPPAKIVAHVQTDPHVIKQTYKVPAAYSDYVFCMQGPYMDSKREIYLPYAFDPTIHYPEKRKKEYDACIIGIQYRQRTELVDALYTKGYNVFSDIGIVYDEYREVYNSSKIALNVSSLLDLPARVWEYMGMGLPVVTNRVPDLDRFFGEYDHYMGFDTILEAVEKVEWLLDNYDKAEEMAKRAHDIVKNKHTWDDRVEFILDVVGLLDA